VYKKLKKRGVVFFAMHRGAGDANAIASIGFQKKWPFSVYNGCSIKGNDQNTNPQYFIFDYEGNLSFDSRYETEGDKAVIKLATRSPDWLVGKIMKKAKSQAKKIASRKGMGTAMVELEEMAKGEDGDEKEAAVYLLGRVKWYIDWMNRKAKEKHEEGRPKAGLEYLKTLSKQFKGHSVGDQAEAQHTAKKTDDKYKDELSAEKLADTIEKAFFSMKPRSNGEGDAKWLRRNARFVGRIKKTWGALKKKFAMTMVLQRAQALVSNLGID